MRKLRDAILCRCPPRWLLSLTAASIAMWLAVGADAQPLSSADAKTSGTDIAGALIALCGVVVSAAVAWITARTTVRSEQAKRQTELALKISGLVSEPDEELRRAARRRFALAIVKVIKPEGHPEGGKVHFIPMNTRITVGRAEDNDIVLDDEKQTLSRWHCGFIADQHHVWIDDYMSLNGTKVAGDAIETSRMLISGQIIEIGQYKLEYRAIRENTILSQ